MASLLLLALVVGLLLLGRLLYAAFNATHPRITLTDAERDSLHGYAPRSFTAPAPKGFEKRRKELAAVVRFPRKD